jgi:hypothetical protein
VVAGRKSRRLLAFWFAILGRVGEPILGKHRRRLLAGARGEVVELGAGTGLNLRHATRTP